MKKLIIPDVIKNNVNSNENKLNRLDINLEKNIDQRRYSIHQKYITNNTTTNNINKNGGLLRFIIDMIKLPFIIVYKLINYIFIKYDIKRNLKLDLINMKKDKIKRKYLKKYKDIYNTDEIF